jgi:hypothetical protein
MPDDRPPEPWNSFPTEVDGKFDRPVVLHCIGGFAIAMAKKNPALFISVKVG